MFAHLQASRDQPDADRLARVRKLLQMTKTVEQQNDQAFGQGMFGSASHSYLGELWNLFGLCVSHAMQYASFMDITSTQTHY